MLYAALLAHWFADFPLQAWGHRHMRHKATSLRHLANHVGAYMFGLLGVMSIAMPNDHAAVLDGHLFVWVAANGILRGCIDYWTSRATAHFWSKQFVHNPNVNVAIDGEPASIVSISNTPDGYGHIHSWTKDNRHLGPFFVTIGFDQFLHVAILVWSGFELGVFA